MSKNCQSLGRNRDNTLNSYCHTVRSFLCQHPPWSRMFHIRLRDILFLFPWSCPCVSLANLSFQVSSPTWKISSPYCISSTWNTCAADASSFQGKLNLKTSEASTLAHCRGSVGWNKCMVLKWFPYFTASLHKYLLYFSWAAMPAPDVSLSVFPAQNFPKIENYSFYQLDRNEAARIDLQSKGDLIQILNPIC